jgi:hypothetical protein
VVRRQPPIERSAAGSEQFTVPAGAPSWVTTQLIEDTIRVWQPYYVEPLTTEDALAIILGVGRLVDVLARGAEP